MNIRYATEDDTQTLASLAETVGLFPSEYLPHMIAPHLAGDEKHPFLVCEDDETVVGFCYLRAETFTDGSWNMLALGVDPDHQRQGAGRALVLAAEAMLTDTEQRVLVIETSTDPAQDPARAFYEALGYDEVGLIPDYWAYGEDKVIFSKTLG